MAEKLNLSGENSLANNAGAVESFPPFNPEQAASLREQDRVSGGERAGLAVSVDEARRLGEMRLKNTAEIDAQAEQWLAQGRETREIRFEDGLTPEEKTAANEGHFAEIQKRRAFIEQLYPVLMENRDFDDPELTAVPDSIRREYSLGDSLCRHMTLAATRNFQGRGDVRYPNGMIMPAYYSRSDAGNFLCYQEARELNDKIFDQDALASFEPKSPDAEAAREQLDALVSEIRTASSLEGLDMRSLTEAGRIPEIGTAVDLETAISWDKLDVFHTVARELNAQEFQIRNNADQKEITDLEGSVAQTESEYQKMSDEYGQAGILKRARMFVAGHRRKMRALRADVDRQKAVLQKMRENYESNWGKWDPEERTFRNK